MFCVALLSPLSHAVKVENLYRASFPVADQTPESRDKLAAAGLARVIVRASGARETPDSEQLRSVLAQANRYMQQFSYENAEEGYVVNLDYAKSAVDTLLRKLDLPIWPDKRPQVLLWLAQDDFQQRQMVNVAEQELLLEAVQQVEAERALPISLPVMDLDDRVAFPVAQAWSLNEQSLMAASSRYQSDVAVLGRLSITGSGQWLASWLLADRGKLQLFDGRAASAEELVQDGLSQVADYLAAQHAIIASPVDSKPHYMQLDNIANFRSYRKVLDYLNSLAMVRHAEPDLVLGDQLRLRLFIDGQLKQLVDAIALDKVLQANQAIGEASQQGVLYYQLPQTQLPETQLPQTLPGQMDDVLQPLPSQGEGTGLTEDGVSLNQGSAEQALSTDAASEISSGLKTDAAAIDASQRPQPPQ